MFNARTPSQWCQRFEFLPHAIIGMLVVLVLVAAGQPIMTDDLWWHLALGDAYAQSGPWLEQDPLLFTSPGPPVAAAWLADLGLSKIAELGGFTALRLTHVLLVAIILALVWSLLRRASDSWVAASLCTGAFLSLSAYRLIQLRPHLLTMLFALLLYRVLLESKKCPSRSQVAMAVALCALWPNLHAGFLLGPALILAEIAGLVVLGTLSAAGFGATNEIGSPRTSAPFENRRVMWLAVALVLGTLATGLSPAGIEPHLAYVVAGSETPSLTRVADEWTAFPAFTFPQSGSLLTPMTWIVFWLTISGAVLAAIGMLSKTEGNERTPPSSTSPGLIALSLLGVIAPFVAVRFLWLGIFPLLLLSERLGSLLGSRSRLDLQKNIEGKARPLMILGGSTASALMLLVGFVQFGDWPSISRSIPPTLPQYAEPYFASKYQAHAVWMLDDTDLEGNLFNEYYMGGFLGYWLAPKLRTFVNGSLNVSLDAMDANLPIRERRGALPGEGFLGLLDRQRIDVFLGMGLPRVKPNNRPWYHTTAHLENAPGWILVFRNITSSVYLRDNPQNADNLERVAHYYRNQGVPFDAERGFDTARVIREARSWSSENGVIPAYYDQLVENSKDTGTEQGVRSSNLLASFYAALGLYSEAMEIDRALLGRFRDAPQVRRRLVWSLLRVGAFAEAAEFAQPHPRRGQANSLLQRVSEVAVIAADAETKRDEVLLEKLSGRIARLPVFTHAEASNLRAAMAGPELRVAKAPRSTAGPSS